jgi:hypothetical protein
MPLLMATGMSPGTRVGAVAIGSLLHFMWMLVSGSLLLHRVALADLVTENWDDILRAAGSLQMSMVKASDRMIRQTSFDRVLLMYYVNGSVQCPTVAPYAPIAKFGKIVRRGSNHLLPSI